MRKIIIAAMLSFAAFSSQAQQQCMMTEDLVNAMKGEYKEQLQFMGHHPDNKDVVVSVWLNIKTKTATVVKTSVSQRISCVLEILEGAKLVVNADS